MYSMNNWKHKQALKKLTLEQFTKAYNEYLQNQEKPKSEIVFYSPELENEIDKEIIELLHNSDINKVNYGKTNSTNN